MRLFSKYWLQWPQGNFDSQHVIFLQALSDSLIGQQLAGGGAQQTALLEEREGISTTLCEEVTKLTTALQEYQDMVQVRYQHEERIWTFLYMKEKTGKQEAWLSSEMLFQFLPANSWFKIGFKVEFHCCGTKSRFIWPVDLIHRKVTFFGHFSRNDHLKNSKHHLLSSDNICLLSYFQLNPFCVSISGELDRHFKHMFYRLLLTLFFCT